jgi:hypothetical protein
MYPYRRPLWRFVSTINIFLVKVLGLVFPQMNQGFQNFFKWDSSRHWSNFRTWGKRTFPEFIFHNFYVKNEAAELSVESVKKRYLKDWHQHLKRRICFGGFLSTVDSTNYFNKNYCEKILYSKLIPTGCQSTTERHRYLRIVYAAYGENCRLGWPGQPGQPGQPPMTDETMENGDRRNP